MLFIVVIIIITNIIIL